MNFYDLPDEQVKEMNIDYDFTACLEHNPQSFNLLNVDKVLAVIEGENNEKDWHWVVRLKNHHLVYLRGGCDYTGWGCQSWADSVLFGADKTLEQAVNELKSDWRNEDAGAFVQELQRQLDTRKTETWREKKDREFGLRN